MWCIETPTTKKLSARERKKKALRLSKKLPMNSFSYFCFRDAAMAIGTGWFELLLLQEIRICILWCVSPRSNPNSMRLLWNSAGSMGCLIMPFKAIARKNSYFNVVNLDIFSTFYQAVHRGSFPAPTARFRPRYYGHIWKEFYWMTRGGRKHPEHWQTRMFAFV